MGSSKLVTVMKLYLRATIKLNQTLTTHNIQLKINMISVKFTVLLDTHL